jgi:hypothetical protein
MISPIKPEPKRGLYRYVTIYPDGSLESSCHTKPPQWKEIQKYVDGSFQLVPYFSTLEYDGRKLNRGTAYCNEEGWVKNMPFNPLASACWLKACPKGDPERMQIAGPLLFVAKDKEKANV